MEATTAARGRAASEEALIAAATELFCGEGPGNVSVRAIAERAGVNHGLVHHYFGSKAGLVKVVLERLAEESNQATLERGILAVTDPHDDRVRRHVRLLARMILDNAAPDELQDSFPLVDRMTGMLQENAGLDARTARIRAVQTIGLVLGWTLFEPFLLRSVGPDEDLQRQLIDDLRPAMIRVAVSETPPR